VTSVAWSSFQTGKNPGKHGVYGMITIKDEFRHSSDKGLDVSEESMVFRGDERSLFSSDIKGTTFPEILEAADKKAVFVNMPLSHPPRTGFPLIGGWMSPKVVYPEELVDKYDFSNYEIKKKSLIISKSAQNFMDNIDNTMGLIKQLYEGEEWDLFFNLFSETDWVMHDCGLDYYLGTDARRSQLLREVFMKIDSHIGWLLDNLGDANILLLSDHGFKVFPKQVNLTPFLEKAGLISGIKPRPVMWERHYSPQMNVINIITRMVLKSKTLGNLFGRMFHWFVEANRYMDKRDTKLFWADSRAPVLYVNDERFYGVVSREDREKVIEEAIRTLKGIGVPMKIFRPDDIYWSDNGLGDAPDIIVAPDKALPKIYLSEAGIINEPYFFHSTDGIVMGMGNDLATSGIGKKNIVDIAPTILHYFGLPVLEDMDGKAMLDIFSDDSKLREEAGIDKSGELDKIKGTVKSLNIKGV
jgi:predicted AlkP superfamily phosphohydrolase/phosphomutase